jgi:hypothetical protein
MHRSVSLIVPPEGESLPNSFRIGRFAAQNHKSGTDGEDGNARCSRNRISRFLQARSDHRSFGRGYGACKRRSKNGPFLTCGSPTSPTKWGTRDTTVGDRWRDPSCVFPPSTCIGASKGIAQVRWNGLRRRIVAMLELCFASCAGDTVPEIRIRQ